MYVLVIHLGADDMTLCIFYMLINIYFAEISSLCISVYAKGFHSSLA